MTSDPFLRPSDWVPRLAALCLVTFSVTLAGLASSALAAPRGELTITVVDQKTKQPIAARMHIKDKRGRPVRPPRTIYWKDHFVLDGALTLELKPGDYQFELERGPEYKVRFGSFTIESNGESSHVFELERFVDMRQEGWWSGELHVHRPLDEIELHMRAEDLHIAPVITWWNKTNLWKDREIPDQLLVQFDTDRFYHMMAGEDEREGGALLYFGCRQPLEITEAEREYPSPVEFLDQARKMPHVHIDIEKPFWWDVPVWISTGRIDSIGLANNHMQRDGMLATEAWGKPRDSVRYPNPHGNGRWTQDIYYKLLECGLRIPPSAGSASGVLANPVGYNRVYVHCGDTLTWDAWWEGLRRGQVVVTNGPMLRPTFNNQLPGHVFSADTDAVFELEVALNLSLRDPVDYLEIVKNGSVVHEVRLSDYAESGGKLPKVPFQSSGWLLVRAVTKNADTFRFASSGPVYVEIGQRPRISRSAAQFFLDWVHERARRVRLEEGPERTSVLGYHRHARDYWQDVVARANVD